MPRTWLLALVAVLATIASMVAVALGWPERTTTQVLLLELAALPLQLAVGMGLLHLALTAAWTSRRRTAAVVFAVGWLAGLLLVVASYLGAPHELVRSGQSVMWLALLAALVLLVFAQPRARGRLTRFIRLDDPDEGAGPTDDDGDDRPGDGAIWTNVGDDDTGDARRRPSL